MAENNQNTEVEDILSSIKNILEEDEQKHGSLSASSGKTDDVVDDVINSAPEVNDILELSPDMRIDETPSAEAPLQGKADADPVASVILEPEDNHTIAEHIETVDTAPEDKSASDNLIANEFSGIDIGVEDMGDEDSSTVLASQPKADNNVSVVEEVVVAPLEEIQVSNEESNTAPEPIAATETPLETKEKELPPVKEEQSSSAIADATVDASANIISNYRTRELSATGEIDHTTVEGSSTTYPYNKGYSYIYLIWQDTEGNIYEYQVIDMTTLLNTASAQ